MIKNKINKNAFSGGQVSIEEHRRLGGNVDVDVPYQYMSFFVDDDAELQRIAEEYTSGRMLTGEMKKLCIEVMQKVVKDFQDVSRISLLKTAFRSNLTLEFQKRALVTEEIVDYYMDPNRKIDPTVV
jgi:tryptophanyl-tRNA synthetase